MKLRFDKTENELSGVELWTTKYGAPQKKSPLLPRVVNAHARSLGGLRVAALRREEPSGARPGPSAIAPPGKQLGRICQNVVRCLPKFDAFSAASSPIFAKKNYTFCRIC